MASLLGFDDVPILPYVDLLDVGKKRGGVAHRGGPLWPDWDRQTVARHCRRGKPVDTPPDVLPPTDTFTEPVAWAGGIVGHFGHQIADFSARILPTLVTWPDAVLVFAVKPESGMPSWETVPRFFQEIVAWFGLDPQRLRIVSRPTLASRLLVAPQGEQFGALCGDVGPSAEYLDALDALVCRRLGKGDRRGAVYVSRAGQRVRFAGETEIEKALSRAGVEVFRPETVPLREQLRRYAGAERLIFAEGSAVHGLQLLGRGLGDVTVLSRRPGSTIARASILARARSVDHLDCDVRSIVLLGPSGRPAIHGGVAVLDEDLLVERLGAIGLPMRSSWDSGAFREARERDVREWLSLACRAPWFSIPGSAESIRDGLVACGLGHLVSIVDGAAAGRRTGDG